MSEVPSDGGTRNGPGNGSEPGYGIGSRVHRLDRLRGKMHQPGEAHPEHNRGGSIHSSRRFLAGWRQHGLHGILLSPEEDSVTTAEKFSSYKSRFTQTVERLMENNELPRTKYLEKRLQVARHAPILVTGDRNQQTHYYDAENERTMMRSIDTQLHMDHEMTHAVLPAFNGWKMFNEGVTQKVALKINTLMEEENPEPKHRVPQDKTNIFYIHNPRVVDEITRITGVTFNEIIQIGSDPERYPDSTAEINNRWQQTENGIPTGMGIIDYGKKLETEGYNLASHDPEVRKLDQFEIDDWVTGYVADSFSNIPSLFPVAA